MTERVVLDASAMVAVLVGRGAAEPISRRLRGCDIRLVDALYVALAESLAAPILTLDRGLAAAAPTAELISI